MDAEPDDGRTDAERTHERASDLQGSANANRDATWGSTDAARGAVPGLISGDLGPKGRVSAQLRDLSRSERQRYGQVPRGTNVPGTGRYLFAMFAVLVLVLLALAVLIGWLAS